MSPSRAALLDRSSPSDRDGLLTGSIDSRVRSCRDVRTLCCERALCTKGDERLTSRVEHQGLPRVALAGGSSISISSSSVSLSLFLPFRDAEFADTPGSKV